MARAFPGDAHHGWEIFPPPHEEFVMGSFTLILLVAWAVVARF